jgi:hypothetical protein
LNVGDYTVFTVGNPLRVLFVEFTQFLVEITQVGCWRLHSFHYGKSLKGFETTQFSVEITQVEWWRLHRLNVGDYTVFLYDKSLTGFEITQFLVEITQVECWRLHSLSLPQIP